MFSKKRWNIIPKQGPGGAGKVTEEEKNSVINKAVSKWKGIGLSREQIAPGVMDRIMEILFPSSTATYSGAGRGGHDGTLERDSVDYRRVWRIEPDGRTRGGVMS